MSCLKLTDRIATGVTQVGTALAGGFPLQVRQNLNRMGSNWSIRPWVGIRGACAYTWPSMEMLVVLERPSC